MSENPYPTWIEINLSRIENNTRTVLKNTGVDVMAVVKTNAYGHGAVETSKAVLRAGAKMLAVVRLSELMELRQAGITAPVMIFGGAMASEVDQAIAQTAVLPVYDAELAKIWSDRALALGRRLPVHLKIDTGMGRFGVFPEQALDFARFIGTLEGLEIEGVMSHLAGVGDYGPINSQTQLQRFKGVVDTLAAAGIRPRWRHLASSSAILYEPDSYFNLVRAGGVLYGLGDASDPQGVMLPGLSRSFCWKAQFVSIKRFPEGWTVGYDSTYTTHKDEIIGVLNVGHGDGYLRIPGGSVLVEGRRCPIVGKICMDQMMVSLPHEYPLGTEAVLIGEQGDAVIPPQELARRWASATTFVTNVNRRIPRVYLRD
ncbi:MAG: alanine racemase [Chloroflexi bacterium]|nr:alanine racemase [Chloroflexota bacterium]